MTTPDRGESNAKTKVSRRRSLTPAAREIVRLYEEQRAGRQARKEEAQKGAAKVQEQIIKTALDKIFRSEGEAVTRDEAERRLGMRVRA